MKGINWRHILFVFLGVLFLGIAYQYPVTPLPKADYRVSVPAGVGLGLLISFLYPRPLEWWTISIFLLIGLLNLPVFPELNGGLEYVKGTNGGYLWGLIPATFAIRLLVRHGWHQSFWQILVSMFIGLTMVFLCGTFWVFMIHGLDRAFTWTMLIQFPTYFLIGLSCTILAYIGKWVLPLSPDSTLRI